MDLKCKLHLYRRGTPMQASQHANVSAFHYIRWSYLRGILNIQYNRIRLGTIAEFVSSDTHQNFDVTMIFLTVTESTW